VSLAGRGRLAQHQRLDYGATTRNVLGMWERKGNV
jgi:hypothetical protein